MNKIDDLLDLLLHAPQPAISDPDQLTERIMRSLPKRKTNKAQRPKARTVRLRWLWAAAACLLLLVGMGTTLLFLPKKETTPPVAQLQTKPKVVANNTTSAKKEPEPKPYIAHVRTVHSPCTNRTQPMYETKTAAKEKPKPQELPDTLGDGIWQSREHVLLALQILAECEASGEQRQRNAVVEAAFLSTPRPKELQLVVSETGDYQVVADDQQPTVIEI